MVCGNDQQGFSFAEGLEAWTGTDERCRMGPALCFCYSGYQFIKGSGWEIRCFLFFFFENHVFMLFLAFSGSGRTREFSFGFLISIVVCIRFFCQFALPCFFLQVSTFFPSLVSLFFFTLYSILFPCGSSFYAGASSQPIHLA